MPCKIINNSGLEIPGFEDMIQSLVSFSQDRFGFEKPPTLFLNSDLDNATNLLGKTAYYDPEQREIHIYTTDRHPKDIMRSISHELVHHHQNCKGDFAGDHYSGEGYAQKDPHMRKMEKEAYLQGNMCFRDWEDSYKQEQQVYNEWRTNTMSLKEWKNKELFGLLSEKWGFAKNVITESEDKDNDGVPVPDWAGEDNVPKWADQDDNDPKVGDALEEQQLDEDKETYEKIKELEAKKKLDDKEREELKKLKQYLQMSEQKLDEEEVDETVRDLAKAEKIYRTPREKVGRIPESIYNKFKKLIK